MYGTENPNVYVTGKVHLRENPDSLFDYLNADKLASNLEMLEVNFPHDDSK